nr:thiamine-phosphate synthase family protein [Methanothermus fervidus]
MKEIVMLKKALKILTYSKAFAFLIPETGTNIVMSKKNPKNKEDIAGIPGRIRKFKDKAIVCEDPKFGASSHLANLILTLQKYDPEKRSAINIKYDKKIIKIAKDINLTISSYDRREEPKKIKEKEGSTISWGAKAAIDKIGQIPDLIYHKGDWGKEPMINIVGTDPINLAKLTVKIAKIYVGEKI